jgi:hypothetical protein
MKLLASCISTCHSRLKEHWFQSDQYLQRPPGALGDYQKPNNLGGLVCLLNEDGEVLQKLPLAMPAGMVASGNGHVLVASRSAIYKVAPDLSAVYKQTLSAPCFNALHSLSRTRQGYLVASTGLDLLLEFDSQGHILWQWWATDYGLTRTPMGWERHIDKAADHRDIEYGTLTHTTHVNSAVECADGSILATLFHQGIVVRIDRRSGQWRPVLQDLDHLHAVRLLDEHHFTVADTGRGRALLVRLENGCGVIEEEIAVDTNWLQDCHYDLQADRWLLVDGEKARLILRGGRAGHKPLAEYKLDPEWRLYDVLVL